MEGIHDVMEGVETSFAIKTYDKYGNNCQGGDKIEVQIVGADMIEVWKLVVPDGSVPPGCPGVLRPTPVLGLGPVSRDKPTLLFNGLICRRSTLWFCDFAVDGFR